MDEQKKLRAREKRVAEGSMSVEKHGEGLGTGPVGNTGGYQERREQEAARPARTTGGQPRQDPQPQQSFARKSVQSNPFGSQPQQRPQQTNPFAQQRPPQSNPFMTPPSGHQGASPNASAGGQQSYHSAVKQNATGGGQKANGTGGGQRMNGTGSQRASGGGGGKFLLIIIALVVLLFGGKLTGLFGGNSGDVSSTLQQAVSGGSGTTSSSGSSSQSSSSGSQDSGSLGDLLGGSTGSGGLSNLLSSFLGSSGSSVYDTGNFSSLLGGLTSGGSTGSSGSSASTASSGSVSQYFTSSGGDNSSSLDENVSKKARDKFTTIRGNNKDTVTIMVYMCGADLESQQGMATSDLKEMANAKFGDKVNLIVYTGGARKWRNNVVSASRNQIYQIRDGAFYCLKDDMGSSSMTSPDTLSTFLKFGKENFSADRMCLIFWDHGGGSVSGYGYDERYGQGQTMTLAGINQALKAAGIRFDFIGFDTCLMATVENGIMLSQYADYLIASEETEPGVGWYYTNWMTQLGKNTSTPTIRIGKTIVDDFVEVCNQKCRGQATTLSVVDLAELEATVPQELTSFSIDTNELIQNKEYKKVSTARSRSREFAQQSRIDQIDLIHFARNMGTDEGKSLAKALDGAIKYNRTGGGISNAYGLSIYFPYKRTNKVSQMVSTYRAIGMDEEYTRCIQEFASLEISGQVGAGTPVSGYGSQTLAPSGLLESLTGQGGGYTTSYSAGGLSDLLGSLYGGSGSSGGSTGSILDLFMGRSMTADKAAEYILENHFDANALVWRNGRISLSKEQWSMVDSLTLNVLLDDGKGYIDLGMDNVYELDGNDLLETYDGTWLSIDGAPVAYYYLNTIEEGDNYVISGYVPAILNGERVNLILNFDSERPEGYIAGALKVYSETETGQQSKELIAIGKGDQVQFVCDYYDYSGKYTDSYLLGKAITLGDTAEIANKAIEGGKDKCKATYCFTDLYQKRYWTPVVE
ncbi:MAG: peptidase C11 [Clostridia bacterium]|nr:peptidase C11 [Clostridia bacterium]